MEIEKIIEFIKKEDKKEIRNYNLFAALVVIIFFLMLCYNLKNNYLKDVGTALTNFVTLGVSYLPFQQISKRRKRIKYIDIAKQTVPEKEFEIWLKNLIQEAIK